MSIVCVKNFFTKDGLILPKNILAWKIKEKRINEARYYIQFGNSSK